MIEKIQNFIADNTSVDVTRNQVVMGFVVIGVIVLLIIVLMFQSGGPQKNSKGYVAPMPDKNAPVHVPGRD